MTLFNLLLQKTVCVDGWPLAIHGKVSLQLGTLNETFVTPTDIYLCIKPTTICYGEKVRVNLCAVWRSFRTQTIVYRILDPYKDSLTSISLEMLTEDLPQLLQSLLVSVEQTISRVPFDELAFPKYNDDDEIDYNRRANDFGGGQKADNRPISGNASPKCAIKRREIITKNKPIQNRYTLRRMSIKTEMDNREKGQAEDIPLPSSTATPNSTSNMMPLFCLGGSFPHIDSDEDGDDGTKSPNDRKFPLILFIFLCFFVLLSTKLSIKHTLLGLTSDHEKVWPNFLRFFFFGEILLAPELCYILPICI